MKAGTLRIISLLTLAAIWEFAGRNGNAHLLPPLSKVVAVWLELLISGQLFHAIAISFQALAIGFFISVLFGIPLGLLMGRYRRVEAFLEVYMTALLAVPMISFIPFLVIAFGLGLVSRVWIVFLFAFVIIAINTTAGNIIANSEVVVRQFRKVLVVASLESKYAVVSLVLAAPLPDRSM